MQLRLQEHSRLLILQILSLDDFFPSVAIWRTENISAARIIPAPYGLAYQKYVTQTTQKIPLEEYLSFIVN